VTEFFSIGRGGKFLGNLRLFDRAAESEYWDEEALEEEQEQQV